ncbi:MAG: hypothetical protein KatS3mg011_1165 [Acidimicrobiia bacterium]|nr:MAG: hypothetical protein KatS3mg011_1165 [Acidimicrobiia bacterium]
MMTSLSGTVLSLILCLSPPVDGPVSSRFVPTWDGGHWGIDFETPWASPVRATGSGEVTFAGSVAGMRSVTIDHGSIRTSLSYLSAVLVSSGEWVARGQVVGFSGLAHGAPAVHLSVREGYRYLDPQAFLCRSLYQVRLLPPPFGATYPAGSVRMRRTGSPR